MSEWSDYDGDDDAEYEDDTSSYFTWQDPLLTCYNGEWWFPWAIIAICGIAVFSLGIPFGVYMLARRNHGAHDLAKRRLVQVITRLNENVILYKLGQLCL